MELQAVSFFHKGGLVMYPLLCCSILILAVALERFMYFRRESLHTKQLLAQIETAIAQDDWKSVERCSEEAGGVVGRILAAGLPYRLEGKAMREMFEETTALEAAKLKKNLRYLSTIVTLAPLLGLLGTVVGMIGSFRVLDSASGNPAAITGGVGEALIATAAGLCVAVMALSVHTYFSHRLDHIITDIESICALALRKARRHAA